MFKQNPYRLARVFLARNHEEIAFGEMYSIKGALMCVLMVLPLKGKNKAAIKKAIAHYQKMVFPFFNERHWLLHNVILDNELVDQDLQDYRNRWLDELAKQWDRGEI